MWNNNLGLFQTLECAQPRYIFKTTIFISHFTVVRTFGLDCRYYLIRISKAFISITGHFLYSSICLKIVLLSFDLNYLLREILFDQSNNCCKKLFHYFYLSKQFNSFERDCVKKIITPGIVNRFSSF